MLTPFCFYGIQLVTFGGEVHKLKEVCVYMPLFCVCNILSTIFSVKKEKKNVVFPEVEENIFIISVLLARVFQNYIP